MGSRDDRRGRLIDYELLAKTAPDSYLYRLVTLLQERRGTNERFVYVRSSDEVAAAAAGDNSREVLELVTVVEGLAEDETMEATPGPRVAAVDIDMTKTNEAIDELAGALKMLKHHLGSESEDFEHVAAWQQIHRLVTRLDKLLHG